MTYEEAVKLCGIIGFADGGCGHCVSDLMNSVQEEWPDIPWRKAYAEASADPEWIGGTWFEKKQS